MCRGGIHFSYSARATDVHDRSLFKICWLHWPFRCSIMLWYHSYSPLYEVEVDSFFSLISCWCFRLLFSLEIFMCDPLTLHFFSCFFFRWLVLRHPNGATLKCACTQFMHFFPWLETDFYSNVSCRSSKFVGTAVFFILSSPIFSHVYLDNMLYYGFCFRLLLFKLHINSRCEKKGNRATREKKLNIYTDTTVKRCNFENLCFFCCLVDSIIIMFRCFKISTSLELFKMQRSLFR